MINTKNYFFVNGSSVKNKVRHIFFVCLAFGLVFNLSFAAMPAISTGRVALLCMLVLYWKDILKQIFWFSRKYLFTFSLIFFLVPFSLAWLAINGGEDTVMFSRALWFLLYVIISAFCYARICNFKLEVAMAYYMVAVLFQALLVLYGVSEPEFRNWVAQSLVMSGNIDFTEGVRFSGLTNSGGANLSVQLSLGVAAALILFSLSRSTWSKLYLLLIAFIICFSTIFVGRTGLYISLLSMMGFIFLSNRTLFIPTILIAIILPFLLYVSYASSGGFELVDSDANLERTINWAFDVFLTRESDSAKSLVSELSNVRQLGVSELLIGSGRIIEVDGSNYSKHDSGYLHSLYALGLPLSTVFYVTLFYIYWRLLRDVDGKLKLIGVIFVALIFILEIKEPFIFKYTLPFFVFVYAYLAHRHIREKFVR